MHKPNVTYHGPRPHVYAESDLHPTETLVQWRARKVEAAKREQAQRTKLRVLASLVTRGGVK